MKNIRCVVFIKCFTFQAYFNISSNDRITVGHMLSSSLCCIALGLAPILLPSKEPLRSHLPFGFSLERFQASHVVDASITPSQSPSFDDFSDIP